MSSLQIDGADPLAVDERKPILITPPAPARYEKSPVVPGAGYDADQNPDGTWNVRRVAIYGTHVRRIPMGYKDGELVEKVLEVNRAWLDKAMAWAQFKREKESFIYPLHINHHEYVGGAKNQPVRGAGFIMPVEIGNSTLDGKPIEILYADFLSMRPEAFDLADKNQLCYVSAEVLDISETIISSVSLMEHDVPYFALPMFTIGKKTYFKGAPEVVPLKASFMEAMSAAVAYSKGATVPTKNDASKPAVDPADATDPSDVDPDETVDTGKGKGKMKVALMAKMDALTTMVSSLVDVIKGVVPSAGNPPGGSPSPTQDRKPAPAAAPAAGYTKAQEDAIKAAEAAGELAGSKAALSAVNGREQIRAKCRKWAEELAGYNLGSNLEDDLYAMCTDAGKGEAVALGYIAGVKKSGTPIPPPLFAGTGTSKEALPAGVKYSKAVMKYAEQGADAVARAHAAEIAYFEAESHGIVPKVNGVAMTRKEWIKNEMDRPLKPARVA